MAMFKNINITCESVRRLLNYIRVGDETPVENDLVDVGLVQYSNITAIYTLLSVY